MKHFSLTLSVILVFAVSISFAQVAEEPADTASTGYEDIFTLEELVVFETYEDSINGLSEVLFNNPDQTARQQASHSIIKTLKSALLLPNSFQYGFPNVESISIVQPEDAAFRLFTWQFIYNNNTCRYYGAIQMHSDELLLYPLVDYSNFIEDATHLVTDNERWIGALYYGIKKVSAPEGDFYTLFGYDGNNAFSTKKIADVLWFTNDGEVRFGAPLFNTGDGKPLSRFVIEFKKGAAAGINYSEEYQKILFDNLVPVDEQSEGMYFNYVPDGSYKGFEWQNGQWIYVDKVFDYKLKDGEFPDESYGDKPSVQERP